MTSFCRVASLSVTTKRETSCQLTTASVIHHCTSPSTNLPFNNMTYGTILCFVYVFAGEPVRLTRDVVLLTDDRNLHLKAHTQNIPVKSLPDFLSWAKVP